jgi:hypothetical protein
MMSFRGQANWTKMMAFGGKLTALACHLTKRLNKAEELSNLSTNITSSFTDNNVVQFDKISSN